MKYLLKIYYILGFLAFYLFKLVQANLVIARDILSPTMKINPGFIRLPLSLKSDTELLLFSNLLSMTPGTLVINMGPDRDYLDLHVLYLQDENIILEETHTIQSRIKKIFE